MALKQRHSTPGNSQVSSSPTKQFLSFVSEAVSEADASDRILQAVRHYGPSKLFQDQFVSGLPPIFGVSARAPVQSLSQMAETSLIHIDSLIWPSIRRKQRLVNSHSLDMSRYVSICLSMS